MATAPTSRLVFAVDDALKEAFHASLPTPESIGQWIVEQISEYLQHRQLPATRDALATLAQQHRGSTRLVFELPADMKSAFHAALAHDELNPKHWLMGHMAILLADPPAPDPSPRSDPPARKPHSLERPYVVAEVMALAEQLSTGRPLNARQEEILEMLEQLRRHRGSGPKGSPRA